jgi:hypothetical protein
MEKAENRIAFAVRTRRAVKGAVVNCIQIIGEVARCTSQVDSFEGSATDMYAEPG